MKMMHGQVLQAPSNQNQEGNLTTHLGVFRYKGRLYVGPSHNWRCKVMQWMHDSSIGGYSGILGTLQRTKKVFYWANMQADVLRHVQECHTCQLNKGENIHPPGLLDPITIPKGAWLTISMDFITGLPKVAANQPHLTADGRTTSI